MKLPTRRGGAAIVAALALLLLLPACAKRPRPVYPASGQLLIDGKPVGGVFVLFNPVDPGPEVERPSATTEPDGTFRLTTRTAYDGGPAGEYIVTLLYEPVTSPLSRPKGPPPNIDGQYLSVTSSPLRARIEPKPANEIPAFRIP